MSRRNCRLGLLKTTIALGNGAGCAAPSKRIRSPQKPHSAMRNNKGMPPCGICPRGEKTNNTPDPGCVHLHNRFGDPVRNSTSIWRVHPANTAPILRESVVFRGKEMPTFGIFGCGTHVQREWALQCVPLPEKRPRCCPIGFTAGKMHVHKDSSRVFP